MSLAKYEIFSTIVDAGSLTKAAERLNLTQSGVSYAVTTLESELGFSLIKRDRSGVTLTPNGERILQCIRGILHQEKLLRQEAAAIKGVDIGTVSIGTLASVSMRWLPGILGEFQRLHPAVEVKTRMGGYDEMKEWIIHWVVDFGFVALPASKQFDAIPLKRDKLMVVIPPEHPLGKRRELMLKELENERLIMPLWGSDDNIRKVLAKSKVNFRIQYEVAEERTILAMVQMGLGISILPQLMLVHLPKGVQLVPLAHDEDYRTIGLAAISLKYLSPAARNFVNCTRAWLEEHHELDFPSFSIK